MFYPRYCHRQGFEKVASKIRVFLLQSLMSEMTNCINDFMDYRSFIVRDSKICGGQPVVRGTRVPVRTVLASLAEGASTEEILESFPTLTEEAIRAVIAFAAVSAAEDLPPSSPPHFS